MTLDRPIRTIAQLATVLAVLLVGFVATPTTTSHAASATQAPAGIVGECLPDQHTIRWTVPDLGAYRVDEAVAEPAGSSLSGLASVPVDLTGELVLEQALPPGVAAASLTLRVTVDGVPQEVTGEQQCADPAAGLLGGFRFDCQWLTVILTNPHDDPVRLTVVPRGGDPVEVTVTGGSAADVQVPAGEGQSVDVKHGERSIVDPAAPIAITTADWAALDCDSSEGVAAEADDLPATGSRVALVAVGALALLGLGGGLYLLARRRRVRFTA